MPKKTSTNIRREKKGLPKNKEVADAVSSSPITRTPAKAKPKNSASTDSSHHKTTEESLESSNNLLKSIRNAQAKYIAQPDSKQFFHDLLADALDLTQSEFGFIAKVLFTDQGKPYLKTHTLTNIAWNQETRKLYDKEAAAGMEFHNLDTLFGTVLTTGKPVISNDPSKDPRSGGTPKGHPPLKSFLGLPFYHGGVLIGMVAMANRPIGYNDELVEYLQPFLLTCANLLQAWDNTLQQKKMKNALQESEEKFRQLTENIEEVFWIEDVVGNKIIYISPAFEKIWGLKCEDLIKNPQLWMESIHPDDQEKVFKSFLNENKKFLITGTRRSEFRIIRPDGSIRWILDRGFPVLNEEGKPIRITGISQDITEFKLAEQNLRESKKQLENKNLALQEILGQVEVEKRQIKERIKVNSEELLLPLIKRLRNQDKGNNMIYDTMERNLLDLTSSFGMRVSATHKLSPKEIEIADLIKSGFESKEIASYLHISSSTVESHRKSIRIKLGLKNEKINLTSYLRSI